MLKVKAILLVSALGILSAGAVWAAASFNYVPVSSCEDVSSGVRISRGGAKYILTNGCRDAGHGVRRYDLKCVSGVKYKVSWTEDCNAPVRDTQAPSVSVSTDHVNYRVNDTIKLNVWASDNVKVSRVEVYRNGTRINSCYNTGTGATIRCDWTERANSVGTVRFYAKAFDSSDNLTESKTVFANVISANQAPVTSVSHRKLTADGVETVMITAVGSDDAGLTKLEIYAGTGSSKSSLPVVKRCEYSNVWHNATCSFSFPLNLMKSGYYWVRAVDRDGLTAETDLKSFSY